MAHYARVNSDNVVVHVTTLGNDIITDEYGVEHEELGVKHLYNTIPNSVGDRWIQTSYNSNFRGNYAGLGYIWNEELDFFIPPKPYDSWIFNEEAKNWDPPTPKPSFEETQMEYLWDEEIKNWIPIYI